MTDLQEQNTAAVESIKQNYSQPLTLIDTYKLKNNMYTPNDTKFKVIIDNKKLHDRLIQKQGDKRKTLKKIKEEKQNQVNLLNKATNLPERKKEVLQMYADNVKFVERLSKVKSTFDNFYNVTGSTQISLAQKNHASSKNLAKHKRLRSGNQALRQDKTDSKQPSNDIQVSKIRSLVKAQNQTSSSSNLKNKATVSQTTGTTDEKINKDPLELSQILEEQKKTSQSRNKSRRHTKSTNILSTNRQRRPLSSYAHSNHQQHQRLQQLTTNLLQSNRPSNNNNQELTSNLLMQSEFNRKVIYNQNISLNTVSKNFSQNQNNMTSTHFNQNQNHYLNNPMLSHSSLTGGNLQDASTRLSRIILGGSQSTKNINNSQSQNNASRNTFQQNFGNSNHHQQLQRDSHFNINSSQTSTTFGHIVGQQPSLQNLQQQVGPRINGECSQQQDHINTNNGGVEFNSEAKRQECSNRDGEKDPQLLINGSKNEEESTKITTKFFNSVQRQGTRPQSSKPVPSLHQKRANRNNMLGEKAQLQGSTRNYGDTFGENRKPVDVLSISSEGVKGLKEEEEQYQMLSNSKMLQHYTELELQESQRQMISKPEDKFEQSKELFYKYKDQREHLIKKEMESIEKSHMHLQLQSNDYQLKPDQINKHQTPQVGRSKFYSFNQNNINNLQPTDASYFPSKSSLLLDPSNMQQLLDDSVKPQHERPVEFIITMKDLRGQVEKKRKKSAGRRKKHVLYNLHKISQIDQERIEKLKKAIELKNKRIIKKQTSDRQLSLHNQLLGLKQESSTSIAINSNSPKKLLKEHLKQLDFLVNSARTPSKSPIAKKPMTVLSQQNVDAIYKQALKAPIVIPSTHPQTGSLQDPATASTTDHQQKAPQHILRQTQQNTAQTLYLNNQISSQQASHRQSQTNSQVHQQQNSIVQQENNSQQHSIVQQYQQPDQQQQIDQRSSEHSRLEYEQRNFMSNDELNQNQQSHQEMFVNNLPQDHEQLTYEENLQNQEELQNYENDEQVYVQQDDQHQNAQHQESQQETQKSQQQDQSIGNDSSNIQQQQEQQDALQQHQDQVQEYSQKQNANVQELIVEQQQQQNVGGGSTFRPQETQQQTTQQQEQLVYQQLEQQEVQPEIFQVQQNNSNFEKDRFIQSHNQVSQEPTHVLIQTQAQSTQQHISAVPSQHQLVNMESTDQSQSQGNYLIQQISTNNQSQLQMTEQQHEKENPFTFFPSNQNESTQMNPSQEYVQTQQQQQLMVITQEQLAEEQRQIIMQQQAEQMQMYKQHQMEVRHSNFSQQLQESESGNNGNRHSELKQNDSSTQGPNYSQNNSRVMGSLQTRKDEDIVQNQQYQQIKEQLMSRNNQLSSGQSSKQPTVYAQNQDNKIQTNSFAQDPSQVTQQQERVWNDDFNSQQMVEQANQENQDYVIHQRDINGNENEQNLPIKSYPSLPTFSKNVTLKKSSDNNVLRDSQLQDNQPQMIIVNTNQNENPTNQSQILSQNEKDLPKFYYNNVQQRGTNTSHMRTENSSALHVVMIDDENRLQNRQRTNSQVTDQQTNNSKDRQIESDLQRMQKIGSQVTHSALARPDISKISHINRGPSTEFAKSHLKQLSIEDSNNNVNQSSEQYQILIMQENPNSLSQSFVNGLPYKNNLNSIKNTLSNSKKTVSIQPHHQSKNIYNEDKNGSSISKSNNLQKTTIKEVIVDPTTDESQLVIHRQSEQQLYNIHESQEQVQD